MRILIAIIFPPLGILLCRRPILAIIFLILWVIAAVLCLFVIGFVLLPALSISAAYIVIKSDSDKRNKKLIEAVSKSNQASRK